MQTPALDEALEALDGVVYWTDVNGVIQGGSPSWNEFALANAAPGLRLETVVGRPMEDFICGEDVRRIYRELRRAVVEERRKRLTFEYRCDAPGVRREMRMSMGPLRRDGAVYGVLYQSQITYERARPPINLLRLEKALDQQRLDGAPTVRVCAFCHAVELPAGMRWVAVEDYYRLGGPEEARLNHAVCPACERRMAGVIDIKMTRDRD